jgi:hypothetical protein
MPNAPRRAVPAGPLAKTRFTHRGLNALIPAHPTPEYWDLLDQARIDVRGFVEDHFELNPAQQQDLDSLTDADIAVLGQMLNTCYQYGLKPRFTFSRGRVSGTIPVGGGSHTIALATDNVLVTMKVPPELGIFGPRIVAVEENKKPSGDDKPDNYVEGGCSANVGGRKST